MCAHRVVWEPPKGVKRQHKAHILGGIEPPRGWGLSHGHGESLTRLAVWLKTYPGRGSLLLLRHPLVQQRFCVEKASALLKSRLGNTSLAAIGLRSLIGPLSALSRAVWTLQMVWCRLRPS